jgi:hypothetical protein
LAGTFAGHKIVIYGQTASNTAAPFISYTAPILFAY